MHFFFLSETGTKFCMARQNIHISRWISGESHSEACSSNGNNSYASDNHILPDVSVCKLGLSIRRLNLIHFNVLGEGLVSSFL